MINYDVYRYRYTDYTGLAGVLAVEEQADFKSNLERLTEDHEFLLEKKLAQESIAGSWGIFDGNVSRRMIALLDDYTRR